MVEVFAKCVCQKCAANFTTPARYLKRGRGKFCSRKCARESALVAKWEHYHQTIYLTFWAKVDQSGGPKACWPWRGVIMKGRRGYGRLTLHGRHVGAHRLALIFSKGDPAEPSLFACHRCDNPPCCNPDHLFWGTPLENTQDCLSKGRRKAPHPRKIDLAEVVVLRAAGHTYPQLAKRYGVGQASIGKALIRARALTDPRP